MIRFFLNHFPTWAVMIGMMLTCCLVGWLIYVLINKYFFKFSAIKDPHFARESIHLASTLCAFILAFMIVLLWQSYSALSDTLMEEAKSIGRLEIFSESLPKVYDLETSNALQAYVESLIYEEWPSMERGQASEQSTQLLNKLRLAIENIDPKGDPYLAEHRQEMLADFNSVAFSRYMRLEHIESTIPTFFLVTIFINMLGMFILMCLLNPLDNRKSHHFYLIAISLLMGLNLSFLMILDYPFSGEWSVPNTPLTYIHF